MLEPSAIDYYVSRRCEIDLPHAVWRICRLDAELSYRWTKDTFLPGLRVEIPENNLDVMGRTFVKKAL